MSTTSDSSASGARTADTAVAELVRMQRMGRPAVDALRRAVSTTLTDVFGAFIRKLPNVLNERAKITQLATERRTCQDLAQMISAGPAQWVDRFVGQVDANLIGSARTDGAGGAQASSDDALVLTRLELRAEALYAKILSDIDIRLDHVRRTVYFPVYTSALAPAGLCRALQDTATALSCNGTHRRMLFDKFDDIVIPELQAFYQGLLAALGDIEERAAEAAALLARETARAATVVNRAPKVQPKAQPEPEPQPQPQPQPKKASAPPAVEATPKLRATPPKVKPAAKPKVDPKTVSMLESFVAKAPAKDGEYTDGSLAGDLLALQTDVPLPGVDVKQEQRWVPLQRISLAGQFLNEAVSDPFVPPELGPQHESVRFPLVKSALTDATLFTAVTHPLRSLVNELMLKSATSRITGTAEARRMAEVLQQVLVQFDLAPDFVREAMLTANPIEENQISGFFEQQKQQASQRKEAVVNEAKRLVIRELELRTFGRAVPQQAIKFLNTSWGPLLVKGLLKHGADNAHWRTGIERMEEMLDQLEMSDREMPPPPDWQALTAAMGADLAAAGLPPERVTAALAGLDEAWRAGKPNQSF